MALELVERLQLHEKVQNLYVKGNCFKSYFWFLKKMLFVIIIFVFETIISFYRQLPEVTIEFFYSWSFCGLFTSDIFFNKFRFCLNEVLDIKMITEQYFKKYFITTIHGIVCSFTVDSDRHLHQSFSVYSDDNVLLHFSVYSGNVSFR